MDPAEMVRFASMTPPMLVLRPGDRVLVCLAGEVAQGLADEIAYSLKRAFPGTDFTVLTGVAGIAVASEREEP